MQKGADKKSKRSGTRLMLRVFAFLFLAIVLLLSIGYGLFLYYRPEIKKAINARLSEEINGEIEIGSVGIEIFRDFPTLAITLQDMHLRGPQQDRHPGDFFSTERVEIQVDAEKLLRKEIHVKAIRIVNSRVFMFKSKSGYTNLGIFKRQKTDTVSQDKSLVVSFRRVQVENMSVEFQDSLQRKAYQFQFLNTENHVLKRDSSFVIHVAGNTYFTGLTFNHEKGSFLGNTKTVIDLHLEFFPGRKSLRVSPSELRWERARAVLEGHFDFSGARNFQLSIQSQAIRYKEGVSVLSHAIQNKLDKFDIGKPIDVDVLIRGQLQSGKKPAVDVRYHFADSRLSTGKNSFEHAYVWGSFMNHANAKLEFNDRNSTLVFDSLRAEFDGIPFRAHGVLRNLEDPMLELDAVIRFNLVEMNREFDKEKFRFKSGRADAAISYAGKVKSLKTKEDGLKGKLSGSAEITDAGIVLVEEGLTLDHLSTKMRFTQDRLDIDQLKCFVNENEIGIRGSLIGFLPLLEHPDKKARVALAVSSPRINLGKMLARKNKTAPKTKKQRRKQLAETMNGIYEDLEFDIGFEVKDFIYNRFVGRNLKGNVVLARDKLKANKMSVDFAAGKVLFTLDVDKVLSAHSPFSIRASVINSGLKEFFYAFNDFNQSAIKYQNLQGKLTMDATFQGMLDKELLLVPSTLLGRTTFSVRNGRLVDFQPLVNMSNFLFRRRDFTDVKFAEVKGDLKVRGTEIDVSRMEIQSSVITAFLEGRYSLKDSTDLSIQLPLSNLKRRDKNYKPKNVGTVANVGPSVFLRARTENGKTEISYDPLKKFRRKKKS